MDQKKKAGAPMLIKFKTDYSMDRIARVEVIRETKESVYVPVNVRSFAGSCGKTERREAKRSEFAQYHDAWLDAHAYLVEKAEFEVEFARERLKGCEDKLKKIKGMKKPEEVE
jgi:hypothetical protein